LTTAYKTQNIFFAFLFNNNKDIKLILPVIFHQKCVEPGRCLTVTDENTGKLIGRIVSINTTYRRQSKILHLDKQFKPVGGILEGGVSLLSPHVGKPVYSFPVPEAGVLVRKLSQLIPRSAKLSWLTPALWYQL
jgi:hypothetical protein